MTTDISVDLDALQIMRLSLRMLYEFSANKGDTNSAAEVLLVMRDVDAAIRRLPEKEL